MLPDTRGRLVSIRIGLTALLLFGIPFLASCAAPNDTAGAPQPTKAISGAEATEAAPPTDSAEPLEPAIPEYRMVTLEWPATVRAGDGEEVRLTLEVDERGNLVPTAESPDHSTSGKVVEIPNLYETHHVFAEARLDMAGLISEPEGLITQPLLPGRAVTFAWSILPEEASVYRGRVWLYLRFKEKVTAEESQLPIYSQQIEIRSTNFLGLSGEPARLLGGAGALLGSALSLDSILPWFWKRLRPSRRVRAAEK